MAAQAFGRRVRADKSIRASSAVGAASRRALETQDSPWPRSDASAPSGARYSVVVPVCEEDASLGELYARLVPVLDALEGRWELILVDDGSRDRSYECMLDLHRKDSRVKVARLSRNFGHQVALTAGLELASGDAIIMMDGDLQHPPELISEFVARWQAGYEVVYGVMTAREGETWFKRTTASAYYRVLSRLVDVEVPIAGDFRLVDRRAAEAFLALPERNRYVRGMFSWIGFEQIGVPYRAAARYAGKSKYTLGPMFRLGTNGIVAFSAVPLRLVLRLGLLVSGLAMVEAVVGIVGKLGGFYVVPGWASLVFVISFLGGIQLIVLGVMGEYMAMMYDEAKRRPMYFIRDLHGFDPDPVAVASPTTPPDDDPAAP